LSEVLVEHPVLFIENLLKLGIGDKGRLQYLKNALKNGTIIHDSDKKFLKKMQNNLGRVGGSRGEKSFENVDSHYLTNSTSFPSETKPPSSCTRVNSINKKNPISSGSDSDIKKIQNQLSELKQSDSKLMDNLELLLVSHEGLSRSKIENSNSYSFFPKLFKGKNTEWFNSVKKNLNLKKYNF